METSHEENRKQMKIKGNEKTDPPCIVTYRLVLLLDYCPSCPPDLFKPFEEGNTQRVGLPHSESLLRHVAFVVSLHFCFMTVGITRREFVVPSFRLRSPTRSLSFTVAVPSPALRVNKWPRSPKSLKTPWVLSCNPSTPVFTHLDPEGQASRTTRDKYRGRPSLRT